MTIDVWMQHPTARFLRHEMFESLRRWTGEAIPEGEIPVDTTVAAMDAGGVSLGVLSAWHAPEGPMIANDEVAALVELHPDRFVALAAVDLHKPMAAVRELRRCVRELGFKGLRVIPWLWGLPPDDRRYYPLYAECVELGVPFCLQVGHTGPLRSSEPGRPIPYLDNVALDFPELEIVGGHIGYPWTEEMVALARKYPNVYIDTSAYTTRRYPPELVALPARGRAQEGPVRLELPDDRARRRRSPTSTGSGSTTRPASSSSRATPAGSSTSELRSSADALDHQQVALRAARPHRARPLPATPAPSRSASSPAAATSRSSSSSSSSPSCAARASCAPSAASRAATRSPASPSEITVLEIVELLDGKLGAGAESIFSEAAEAARAVLSNSTIADIVERENRDAGATMYYI